MMGIELIRGNILNVFTGDIYPAEIEIEDGIIRAVRRIRGSTTTSFYPDS